MVVCHEDRLRRQGAPIFPTGGGSFAHLRVGIPQERSLALRQWLRLRVGLRQKRGEPVYQFRLRRTQLLAGFVRRKPTEAIYFGKAEPAP